MIIGEGFLIVSVEDREVLAIFLAPPRRAVNLVKLLPAGGRAVPL